MSPAVHEVDCVGFAIISQLDTYKMEKCTVTYVGDNVFVLSGDGTNVVNERWAFGYREEDGCSVTVHTWEPHLVKSHEVQMKVIQMADEAKQRATTAKL